MTESIMSCNSSSSGWPSGVGGWATMKSLIARLTGMLSGMSAARIWAMKTGSLTVLLLRCVIDSVSVGERPTPDAGEPMSGAGHPSVDPDKFFGPLRGRPRMRENRVRSLAEVDPAWRSEPEDKFDPGNRWWGCALLPRARGSDSFPSLFGSCGRPRSCNPLRGRDIDDGRSRRCRTGGGADRGARSGQGRSGGMCASAEPPPARQADAGAARLRHHHGTTVGDGGVVAAVGRAAGGDGMRKHLLEAGVLPAGGRGV